MPHAAFIPPTVACPPAPVPLAPREADVLTGMCHGLTNAQIGRALFLSEDTVKTYARRLFTKLGVRDRAGAVHVAHTCPVLVDVGVDVA